MALGRTPERGWGEGQCFLPSGGSVLGSVSLGVGGGRVQPSQVAPASSCFVDSQHGEGCRGTPPTLPAPPSPETAWQMTGWRGSAHPASQNQKDSRKAPGHQL